MPTNIEEDHRGRIWLFFDFALPMLFSGDGRYLRTVGRLGDGPGEFRMPRAVVSVPGDSVLVFDAAGRAVLFDRNFAPARTIAMPVRTAWRAAVLEWPKRVVLNAIVPTSAAVGWPLHLADLSGSHATITTSFGANDGVMEPSLEGMRILETSLTAPGSDGRFWSAEIGRYRMTRWSHTGTRIASLERRPTWFLGQSMLMIGRVKPPEPQLKGFYEDDAGRLWVFTLVPAPNFTRAWRNAPPRSDGTYPSELKPSDILFAELYRTRIEVIDPVAQSLVAVADYPGMVLGTPARTRAVVYAEDEQGVPRVRIVSFSLLER